MRRYSEAVKADVRRRMSPPHRQSVARISKELGIHVITVYKWRKTWRLQGEVVPASEKAPEGWSATDKFTVVLETDGLNATELSTYCRERGLFPEQVERWRQASQDANDKPVLTLKEQKELEKLRGQDQRDVLQHIHSKTTHDLGRPIAMSRQTMAQDSWSHQRFITESRQHNGLDRNPGTDQSAVDCHQQQIGLCHHALTSPESVRPTNDSHRRVGGDAKLDCSTKRPSIQLEYQQKP
jgi:transposase-like protein